MAAGDVTVQIHKISDGITAIDTAVTALRVTANDKWLLTSISDGLEIMVIHIEEA